MVETIGSLANKGMKTGITDSTVSAEHILRMKGILGSLNERNVKSNEPLGVSLKDLRETDKRGKWWLVGASFKIDESVPNEQEHLGRDTAEYLGVGSTDVVVNNDTNLARLARQLGMNTDVRRSIFVTIMSSDDYATAHKRLQKLPLSSNQKTEIPRILIRCSSAQGDYNPFFTLLARRLISADPRRGKDMQFSMRNLFDKMRELPHDDEADEDKVEQLELRSILNLARMFGTLIAEDGLSLRVPKDLNFAYLPEKLQHFTELLLITVILRSQMDSTTKRNETSLINIFLKPKEMPEMARGLQFFLKKVVSKTDLAGSNEDQETVRWGCRVARDALKAISTPVVAN